MKSKLDIDVLLKECESLEKTQEGDYVAMVVKQSDNSLLTNPILRQAASEIAGLTKLEPVYMMVNFALPKSSIPKHRDFLVPTTKHPERHPKLARYHLVLSTNEGCTFCGEHMPLGEWFGPIAYWEEHWSENSGDSVRCHLIVDLQ